MLVLIVRLKQGGITALRCAAERNMVETAHLLLQSKASLADGMAKVSVDCTRLGLNALTACACVGQNGWTLLHKAAYMNSLQLAKLLIGFDAEVGFKALVRAGHAWCHLLNGGRCGPGWKDPAGHCTRE